MHNYHKMAMGGGLWLLAPDTLHKGGAAHEGRDQCAARRRRAEGYSERDKREQFFRKRKHSGRLCNCDSLFRQGNIRNCCAYPWANTQRLFVQCKRFALGIRHGSLGLNVLLGNTRLTPEVAA